MGRKPIHMTQLSAREAAAAVAMVWRKTCAQQALSPAPRAIPAIDTPPMEIIRPIPRYR